MTWKLLSDAEMEYIIDEIPDADLSTLEELYHVLMEDILRRADEQQRERLYEVFSRWYRVKANMAGEKIDESILDKSKWMHPGKPFYVSRGEEHFIEATIESIYDIGHLESYYDFVRKNVFPRATTKEIEKIMAMFDVRKKQIEMAKKEREKFEKIFESEEYKNKPNVGDRVRLKDVGIEGTVINRTYTTTEVQVRWDTGEKSWVDAKYLEKI